MGKEVVFTTTLIEWSGFNPHPSHVVVPLDKTLYDDYLSLLGGFEHASNSVDKKSRKFTGTLDHRKLLRGTDSFNHEVVVMKSVRIVQ